MPLIRTVALIPALPEKVWDVLADFSRYAEWNPLNLEAHGEARLGARLPMVFRNLARPTGVVRQTVTLVACERGRSLAWAGRIPLLFNGRHHFELEPEGEGTRLRHGEDLHGLIPATFSAAQISRDFVPAYEAVNRALAERVAAL
ncbi:SRPBCC domain-containing protein [Phenylobacterium aquaticum]|uniref:SRPBCC domain-containing protein n=1 Tax=Phenylobacterium aquaticum TaxID=1763816 RepID=UPI0026EEFC62|nr:SRPBCC domain-containing protein [Phenylobacterium aquaticum]